MRAAFLPASSCEPPPNQVLVFGHPHRTRHAGNSWDFALSAPLRPQLPARPVRASLTRYGIAAANAPPRAAFALAAYRETLA